MQTNSNEYKHHRSCNLCEAMCGVEITLADKKIISIRGDKDDPFSKGHICPKVVALEDLYNDKDRLKYPVRRTSNGWEKISWTEAFDEVAKQLKSVQSRYGNSAVGVYFGNPTIHNYGTTLFGPMFFASLHTKNKFSATSVDQLTHHIASYFMFGHQLLLPVADIERTDFMLILGANPVVSNGSLLTAPDMAGKLKALRKRGGKVVLVDPRRTETARLASEHLFIRPGTDVFLLLAILNVIFKENLVNLGRLAAFTDGLKIVKKAVADFPPEKVAEITGIAQNKIQELARSFAKAKTAVCYGRMGVSTQEFGGVCQWLINVLNIVTGNLDKVGGALFTLPAFDPITAPESLAPKGSYGRWHSRVRKLPEFAGELPSVALAEEILTPGKNQIKALVTSAGNPVLSTPNGQQLDSAFASLEFMVSIDFYINETTRHAHIILPPTVALEHDNYDLALSLLAVENVAKYSPVLFEPDSNQRHDWQIYLELQSRMESKGGLSDVVAQVKKQVMSYLGPSGMLDLGLQFGPYGTKFNPFSSGLSLNKLKETPHGVSFGQLEPCLPERLFTPAKTIKLAPEIYIKDLKRVKEKLTSIKTDGLFLIGRRQLSSSNSWLHNSLRLVKGRPKCVLLINPEDASKRNITNGQTVVVSSRVGRIEIPVEISEEMMLGVVSIPHGWGHNRSNVELSVAKEHAGASLNDLTDELAIDAVSGTAAFSGVSVEVEAVSNRAYNRELLESLKASD
ncbi:MAG: molybdopterin-dependent oxidoreductase [Acidobacteria bacterium]|nr:molybdopterin-dependent oxidoreductase [Acidobacteriota bacterium]